MAIPKKAPDIHELIVELGLSTHASNAILIAANFDEDLSDMLAHRLPKLSKRLREKLFTGYGPFASFSAKIDVAYAMDLISGSLRRELHAIRDIRNEFAHSPKRVHFHSDELKPLLKKFPDYDPKMDPYAFYSQSVEKCRNTLTDCIKPLLLADALKKRAKATADTSSEKS